MTALNLPCRLLTVVLLGSASAITGCSLIDPYVRVSELDATGPGAAGGPIPIAGAASSPLQGAIDLAARQRAAYYGAVSDRAKLRNGLPLVLVPLGVAAAYKGITTDGGQSTRNLLVREGLIGAGLFGLGSYYTSSTREQVYLAGAKALSCSIYAATPYYLPQELENGVSVGRQGEVRMRINDVRQKSVKVRDALARAVALDSTGTLASSQTVKFADPLLARGRASIVRANKTLQQAGTVQATLADAPARLRMTVENIVNQVNEQLAALEPDPASILSITAGLATTAKKLVPGVEFTRAGAASESIGRTSLAHAEGNAELEAEVNAAKKAAQELALEIDNLDDDADALQFAAEVVARRLQSAPSLDTCQVTLIKGRLDISPPDTELEMHVGETRQFTVRSTIGIPSVEWVGTFAVSGKQPVSLQRDVAGNTLIVKATYDQAVAGLTQVEFEVADAALQQRSRITLKLADAAAERAVAPQGAASAAATRAARPGSAATPPQDTAAGNPRPTTGTTSTVTRPQASASSPTPAPANVVAPGPHNATETGLTPEQIKGLQARLGIAATGELDAATRRAVADWQSRHGMPQRDGSLNTATLARIMMP